MAVLLRPALALLYLLSRPSASQFLDLNSLRAFTPAITPSDENVAILAIGHTLHNLSSSTAYALSPKDTPTPKTSQESGSESGTKEASPNNLLKRATTPCGDYNSCSSLGAPSLCCAASAICSADYQGHVGCCPVGAACTGTIPGSGGVIVSSTTTITTTSSSSQTSLASNSASTTTTTTASPTNSGFVIAGSSTVVIFGQGTSGAEELGGVRLGLKLMMGGGVLLVGFLSL